MATKAWNVEIGGAQHYVELDHGTIMNDVELKVDDQIVIDRGMSFTFGHVIDFEIHGSPAQLEISTEGTTWDYALKVNDRVVPQL